MAEITNKNRILYPDILRVITIYAVLVIHVCGVRWYTSFGTPEWYVLNTYLSSLRWCIPVFFMLSGIIILDPKYNLTFKKLYTKSLPRLVCALIFWALVYRILSPITSMLLENRAITSNDWERLYTELLYGTPWHHLWFMYAIIGIYVLAPLLRVFTANAQKIHYVYFLALYLIFGSVIPRINEMYSIHLNFGIYELYSYTGYFIAGYFFSKYDLTKLQRNILYASGIAALIWTVASSTYSALSVGAPVTHYFGNTYPNNMIMAYAIFVFAKNFIGNSPKMLSLTNNKLITSMANCSLGIYLIHDFFNILLKILNISTDIFPAIISAPILALFVYFGAYGITLVIKKIPILNKWII